MIQNVIVIGGGMIVRDQILPSFYQLQRRGAIGGISIWSRHESTLRELAEAEDIRRAFPKSSFQSHDDIDYQSVIGGTPKRGLVVVALPDHLHREAVLTALSADQHVIVVKPLVLTVRDAEEIEAEARERELFVGIEYHKRFDDRSLMARQRYRAGMFGEFRLGSAVLMEKWHYRHSRFQEWFTTGNTDAFTYIGCHYVDLVAFITGLQPVQVSVYGLKDSLPNGNEGWLWTDARVIWENGACLNVQNSLSFPDDAPGSNTQALTLHCSGRDRGGLLRHSDQYRGVEYVYAEHPGGAGSNLYAEPSPDYFQYVDMGEEGLAPAGYGYRSIAQLVAACERVESSPDRAAALRAIDDAGMLATPANSRYNERVIEAARRSVASGGSEITL